MRSISYHTEPGGGGENGDHVLVGSHNKNGNVRICMMADGKVLRRGEETNLADAARASRVACETAFEAAAGYSVSELFQSSTWRDVLRRADEAVSEASNTGTTLLGFAASDRFVCGASVGESKLYSRFAANRVTELTARQWKNPPLGSGHIIVTPFFEQVPPGSVYMAASDGAWKHTDFEDIQQALGMTNAYNAIEYLRAAVVEKQGSLPDDFSVIELCI
jgi:hypothetical protein